MSNKQNEQFIESLMEQNAPTFSVKCLASEVSDTILEIAKMSNYEDWKDSEENRATGN